MPETSPPPAGLPLFFNRIVGVDPALHGNLRIDRSVGYGFAARTKFVPLGLEEFEAAAQDYPILFTASDDPIAVALLGLQSDSNVFVDIAGNWKPGTYIPAYVRAFPFVLLEKSASEFYLSMEPDAACLSLEKGEPLFQGTKPSKALDGAMKFVAAVRNNLLLAAELARTLDRAGLLEPEEAKIDFVAGGSAVVRSFRVLKRERLEKVNDETFLDWRRRKWVAAIDAHLFSAGRWVRLMELHSETRARKLH